MLTFRSPTQRVVRGRIQPVAEGAISIMFGSQASLRVRNRKRDEDYFTTLLWQNNGRRNDLVSQMLFSEFYKIVVNKVTCVGFKGAMAPIAPLVPSLRVMQQLKQVFVRICFLRVTEIIFPMRQPYKGNTFYGDVKKIAIFAHLYVSLDAVFFCQPTVMILVFHKDLPMLCRLHNHANFCVLSC